MPIRPPQRAAAPAQNRSLARRSIGTPPSDNRRRTASRHYLSLSSNAGFV